ncbi:MAG TPA: CHAP domain-containing protein [Solirubrobacteraceae bacterium]|nr:CHAP domain-containing protein [Solirubrobacteraceae bacterium]
MSVLEVQARIAELQGLLNPQPKAAPATISGTPATAFQTQLDAAAGPWSAAGAAPVASGGTPAGQAILNLARGEVGVTEQPPGSNDSPRIAQFRQATAGSGVGPWCAYFTSWAAREAGVPLGDAGQGFGRVDDVWAWAERSGKAIPAGGGRPQPGDLIVWDEHIGIVESVAADGKISTIEGNSSDSVARRTYGSDGGGAVGFVRLG